MNAGARYGDAVGSARETMAALQTAEATTSNDQLRH